MKKTIRFTCLVLMLLTVLVPFAACSDKGDE